MGAKIALHRPQHPESPTWCIRCGTFDMRGPCPGGAGYDMRTPEGAGRMAAILVGKPKEVT